MCSSETSLQACSKSSHDINFIFEVKHLEKI